MKKFLMFIVGFVTASVISFAVIHKILKLIIEVLADLDILIYFKEGLLMTLGKAMGLREFEFKPRRRFSYRDYKDVYGTSRRMSEEV